MTQAQALDTLLTAVFADQPSPEGGPYGAAPLPLGPWVRLVKGAMTDKGGVIGPLRLWCKDKIQVSRHDDGNTSKIDFPKELHLAIDGVAAFCSPITGLRIAAGGLGVCCHADFLSFVPDMGKWSTLAQLTASVMSDLLGKGYTFDGKTLRATSPCDITLSLKGETVTAEFNPPLQATAPLLLGIKATRGIGRINATETQLHVEVDGAPDQYIAIGG